MLSTFGCLRTKLSNFFTSASLAAKLVPSGSHISTISSGRLESGKNCFSMNLKPKTPSAKTARLRTIVVLRNSTHQLTSARKRRNIGVSKTSCSEWPCPCGFTFSSKNPM